MTAMSKIKILVVEDEGAIAANIQMALESLGYHVTSVVTTGEMAVQKSKEDNPDIILMDIELPGDIDGIDAAEEIQRNSDIPILYLTAHSDEKVLERAKITEPFAYIIKPFQKRELYSNIEMTLQSHRIKKELIEANNRLQKEISERKQLEQELKKHRNHLEDLIKDRTEKLQKEIVDRKLMENQIKSSLKEKEILLREIHHRVKNNLQTIISLIRLQYSQIYDKTAIEILKESENRIHTMALIHEKLYTTDNFANINFGHYIKILASELIRSYEVNTANLVLDIEAENLTLGIDTAIPCGLILNELLSNSLKYAFPQRNNCQIKIIFKAEPNNRYQLSVFDNGIGISKDLKLDEIESLGLNLVKNWVNHELQGTVTLDRDQGTRFSINFKAKS